MIELSQCSPRNKWELGGIIDTHEWKARPGLFKQWNGEPVWVARGDVVRFLRTAGEKITFIDVVRA